MAEDNQHSSWHPALRMHNSSDEVPRLAPRPEATTANDHSDFFHRIPEEQPEPIAEETLSGDTFQGSPAEVAQSDVQESNFATESLDTSAPITQQASDDAHTEESQPIESPNLIPEPTHDSLEDSPHVPEPEVQHAEPLAFDEPQQVTPRETEQSSVEEAFGSLDREELEYPREQYEYQGQTTAADDAVDESDDAPLMEDEETLPTPGFATDGPAINAHDVPFEPFHSDPSAVATAEHVYEMTTGNAPSAHEATEDTVPDVQAIEEQDTGVAEVPEASSALEEAKETLRQVAEEPIEEPVQVQSQSSAAFEWGDDDQTEDFGAVVGNVPAEENNVDPDNRVAGSGIVASQATALAQALQEQKAQDDAPVEEEKSEEDLAAMWSAALDDDDFLDDNAVDPSGFFDDDGEGFLDDFDTTPAPAQQVFSPDQSSPGIAPVYDAQGNTMGFTKLGGPQEQINAPANPYSPAPQQQNPYLAPTLPSVPLYNQQQQPVRPALNNAQSFADKSKGGYSSPYDLPEDIVQPRRRPAAAIIPNQSVGPAPPPRSSSMQSTAPPLSRSATAAPSATIASPPMNQSPSVATLPPKPATSSGANRSASGFFEELPMVPKPRTRPSGAYTPAITSPSPPRLPPQGMGAALQTPPQGPPIRPPSRPVMPPPAGSSNYNVTAFRQPEKLPLLPDVQATPQQLEPPQPTGPPASSRYSPAAPAQAPSAVAPPPVTGRFSPMPPPAPAATSRYSPAPQAQAQNQAQNKYATMPAATPAARPVQPFAPRTSSPLAYHEKPAAAEMPPPSVRSVSYQPPPPVRQMSGLAEGFETQPRRDSNTLDQTISQSYASPPRANPYAPLTASPDSRIPQAYPAADAPTPSDTFSPPRRSKTQSPGTVMKGPLRAMTQIERPTSAAGAITSPTLLQRQDARAALPPARQQFSSDLSFTVPQDERAQDPLERYKGCPVFTWGPSGSLVSTFPKQAPFYAAGHAIPTIKCSSGHITIHDTKTTYPLDERDAKFPGPLNKGKSKKKDTLAWITGKIEDLEKTNESTMHDFAMSVQTKKRVEEKVILWKMVKLLLEHDNKIEGNAAAEEAARKILLPNLAQPDETSENVTDDTSSRIPTEPVSAKAIAQIRTHLLEGDREKAVWHAAEQKMWSHALLIASVAGPDIWKQVVQEFVRSQVKDASDNSQSLAALYEVFAGNWEESIDELVPPSARAGFQMISKAGPSAKNPLDGLDQWRETLCLIISNRSNNDVQAIAALGKLLSSYGRSEAAHTCFLFAKASAHLGGADDEKSDFVLLGADHKNQSQELSDLDSIMLTEIYELCVSLAPAPGTSPTLHHLQAFKYQHAQILTEHGLRSEAQAYCDAIMASFKASTRLSPYYSPALLSCVDDLNRCLSQAPQASSSGGWIPKPSMDKVSGSMWKRFNTFVAGDDDDQKPNGSTGSEGAPAGPFGGITGETPTVSRTASVTDLYGAMSMGGSMSSVPGNAAPNRYAPPTQPGGASAARYAPSAYAPSRGSMESTRSYEQERPGTGYSSIVSPTTAAPPPVQRASSTPFGAYLPQQSGEGQQSQSLGVPRPEASRAVSDYRVQYSQPPSRRESVQSGVSESRSSLDQVRPAYGNQPEPSRHSPYQPSSYTPLSPIYGDNIAESAEPERSSSYEPHTQSPYQPSEPTPVQDSQSSVYTPTAPQESSGFGYEPPSSYEPSPSYDPPSSYEPQSSYAPTSSYEPPSSHETPSSYEPPSDEPQMSDEPQTSSYAPPSYEPPTSYAPPSSYEPPTGSSGYEPPTSNYQPYEPEPDPEGGDDQTQAQPKKKNFMDTEDDDDEIIRRAAALKKAADDKAADEAFRKAAEEDAKRDDKSGANGDKKGWFGGWFGKKDPNAQPGPIRAKLGEQSSFYYDPDLKKWVNKKGGAEAAAPTAATPPPPRGPPSRSVSNTAAPQAGPPMSGPPSRVMTPASGPPSGPPSMAASPAAPQTGFPSASAPPPLGGLGGPPGSAPPSRPATSMSNASSIDDLLGAPGPRKGGTAKSKKRGGRYVDVMAKP
ncbi:hypothetical protein D6D29_02409 [Aureobasidium pullulans]|nr:hypothetical protein D6D29_02409 [Aureobasidium pullulans]